MPLDRTGADAKVTAEPGRFVISVDGRPVGLADYVDHDVDRNRSRTFPHTEVDAAFQGRGLASILVAEALRATREAGLRVVPVCSMVADYVDKHPESAQLAE